VTHFTVPRSGVVSFVYKHSSLFCIMDSDKKKSYNTDTKRGPFRRFLNGYKKRTFRRGIFHNISACYVLRVTCYVLRVTCYVLRVTCYEVNVL
jgi:hypothetical protein